MTQELKNIRAMISCNAKEFETIINKSVGSVWMSSGSYYTPFYLMDDNGFLAEYDSKGTLRRERKAVTI